MELILHFIDKHKLAQSLSWAAPLDFSTWRQMKAYVHFHHDMTQPYNYWNELATPLSDNSSSTLIPFVVFVDGTSKPQDFSINTSVHQLHNQRILISYCDTLCWNMSDMKFTNKITSNNIECCRFNWHPRILAFFITAALGLSIVSSLDCKFLMIDLGFIPQD